MIDNEWDTIYANRKQICRWPFSDLVSIVSRNIHKLPNHASVLELGCGAGPNIPFFLENDFDYFAIERSKVIVEDIIQRFPQLKGKVIYGDFTQVPFGGKKYDLIFDRAAITHNTSREIEIVVDKIYSQLAKGGIFIGIDWFSTNHSDYGKGIQLDEHTRTNILTGQFKGVGKVHFFSLGEIEKLFARFKITDIWNKTRKSYREKDSSMLSSWDFVVIKKN